LDYISSTLQANYNDTWSENPDNWA